MRRKNGVILKLNQELKSNKRFYVFAALLFLAGIVLGSIFSAVSDAETDSNIKGYIDKFLFAYPLQGAAGSEIFKLSAMNNIRFLIILSTSGCFIYLIPLGAFQIGLKGFRIGYTIAYLLKCYGFKGILLALFSVMPQNIILIPLVCFFFVSRIKSALSGKSIAGTGVSFSAKRKFYTKDLIISITVIAIVLICSVIEGYLVPIFLKPVCSLFV